MKRIAIGFYAGLGDVISAIPALSNMNDECQIHVFVKSSLLFQCGDFLRHQLPDVLWIGYDVGVRGAHDLFRKILKLGINELYISPHAPPHQSSRKIPFVGLLLRAFSSGRVRIRGDRADRYSFLYTDQSNVSRRLKLRPREVAFFSHFGLLRADSPPRFESPAPGSGSDVFIHYGASSSNKLTDRDAFVDLARQLSNDFSVTVSAIKDDLIYFRKNLPGNINFCEGSISELIDIIGKSKVVLTHDTGFAHVAGLFEKPQIVLFGPTDPEMYLPANSRAMSYVTDKPAFRECMPCASKVCGRSDGQHCLGTIDELRIGGMVRSLLPPDTIDRARRADTCPASESAPG